MAKSPSRRRTSRASQPMNGEGAAPGPDGSGGGGWKPEPEPAASPQGPVAGQTTEVERLAGELARAQRLLGEQRSLLQAIFENTSDAIIVTDLEGRPLMVNPAAVAMVGPFPADMDPARSQQLHGVYRPDRETPFPPEEMPLMRAMREDAVVEAEAFLKHTTRPGGTWISGLACPLRDATAAVVGGVVNVRDVTERKQAEESLRVSEARLRAIVETAFDAIITIDEALRIEGCNPATERIFGYPPHALIGHPIAMLMPSPYREEFKAAMARFQQPGKPLPAAMTRELIARRSDGTTLPIDLTVSQFRHGKGSLFTAIIRDVSERRAFEEKLLSIAEEEQRRIGQDLHDDIGQELTGLALKAETLAELIGDVRTVEPARRWRPGS